MDTAKAEYKRRGLFATLCAFIRGEDLSEDWKAFKRAWDASKVPDCINHIPEASVNDEDEEGFFRADDKYCPPEHLSPSRLETYHPSNMNYL